MTGRAALPRRMSADGRADDPDRRWSWELCCASGRHMHVRLLGGFGVEVDGRTVDASRWRLTKARTVVKLLALDPVQRLHREYLLDLLWPDLAPVGGCQQPAPGLDVARRALAGKGTDGLLELRDQVVVLRSRSAAVRSTHPGGG